MTALGLFALVGLVAALATAWPNLARAHTGDASLTALTVTPGTLSPAFSSTVTDYTVAVANTVTDSTVAVANTVTQITIEATPDGDGTVAYQNTDGTTLTDADTNVDGQQVDLPVVGGKRIDVVVTHGTDTQTYTVLVSREGTFDSEDPCAGGGYNPTPTAVAVDAVPIVVASTTADYFVLYVRDLVDPAWEAPVSVTRGEAGTTSLTENVEALPKERYRVEKYLVADPADVDGDCTDDITELDNLGSMNPVNAAPSIPLSDGVSAIPDQETFNSLSFLGSVQFFLIDIDTNSPRLYFINGDSHATHNSFLRAVGLDWYFPGRITVSGEVNYYPQLVGPDGSSGVYVYRVREYLYFSHQDLFYRLLAASMPLLENDLAYYISNYTLQYFQGDLPHYAASGISLLFAQNIAPESGFIPLNEAEGYGLLRVMELEDRPNPRDVVIYEAVPNELPRVAGIITTVPQTPLSHVNLRAIQDGVPNAYIRDASDKANINDLIGNYVYYTVSETRYTIRAATKAEVDAHHASSRPTQPQTPERDLSVTAITPLSQIDFDDWDAFGVKAANVAVLGTLAFPDGTVPDGFAIPFYFYDEFMKHNDFYTRIETMLADSDFQTDYAVQDDMLDDLRDDIEDADTPQWIIDALTTMNESFAEGVNRRYRSSTNNEDLPGFNGAGLYDSKSQKPSEDEDDLAKSLKEVYASLWNFRAFIERDFHRIDHTAAAMGILVHPSYKDEEVNGVAVSFDPVYDQDGAYYVNSQVGEDLVTNPDALSVPEEVLLHKARGYTILSTSNQAPPGSLLMSDDQLNQLRRHLAVIHAKFTALYNPSPDEPFAMEIEFKITSENILAIKQARPWVFGTVRDNDTPGVMVLPTSLTIDEGNTDTYTVELNTQPSGDMMVAISSNNTDVTVSSSPLTFTTTNWNSAQTVTVTAGQDADAADDKATLTHNPSGADYGSVSNAILMVTVTDDETAGVTVTPTSLTVNEGGTNTYTIVLDTEPTDTVTVAISSNNTDVTVSASPLTVWDTAVTVTVSAAEDADSTHDTATVTHTVTGGDYNFVINVIVTVTDNDTPGVTVTPLSLTIGEGSTGTYAVVLNTQPSGNVMVAIRSNNTDVTVPSSTLTFTMTDWNTEQTVTVTAGQDADAANDMATLTHNPSGGGYNSVSSVSLMVTVTDDEMAGVTVTPTSLTVNEGGTNTYTVVLDTQPTATVTVTIVDPTDNADVTANPASLTFSTSDWNTEQTVTVSADEDADSTQDRATVTHTVSGGDYGSVTASGVSVTVTDNDTPGVTVTPPSLTVGEGGTGRYTVRLNTQPSGNVMVAISSNNTDVTVPQSSSTLTFTTTSWSTEQTVTVSAGQDADAANDMATLTHNPSGGGYGSVSNAILMVTVTDYDTARLELSVTFLDVDEGGQNTYTVKLQTQPTTTVTVTVSSDDTDAATVSGPTLRFTTSNWDTEQTVTVRGVNDGDSDDETVTITNTASGGEYAGVTASVTVTVDDDDTRGITFTPAARTIREGATGTYDVKLNTAPTADVTVAISSDNPDVTVNKSSLTFTTVNYARNQRVTVTAGQDADAADGTANLTHRPSGGDYSAGEAKDFMVTVTDDDTAGLVLSATTLGVDEAGQNTYTVKLQTEPTTTVTVTVSSGDPGAATATVSGSTLIFTASNWETEQTVTVEGVDDGDSANETVTVTNTASGGEYEGVTASVRVTVDDDDKPGITFTPASLTVGEAGVGRYTVRLNAAPTSDVTVAISSSNPDVTVNKSSLTFTTVNYATNQRVTVAAAEDADAADDTANLTHRPSGGGYGSGQNKDLIVTVTDYDTARLELSVWFLDVDEGGQNTYTVKLQTQPTTTVTVTVSSDDTDAATVSGPTLRFTPSNWDTEQTVTVRGVNDGDSDDETVTITNTASGGEYAGVTETVWLFVDDDDTRGITFTPAARTIREGATGTYDVKLNTAPTADVTVAISSDNPDVTVNKSSLTFTTVNYATNQRVTVTAAQDADAADGTANLTHRPSGDDYSAGEAKDFMVTVTDDDTAGLMLSATTLGVDEAGQNTYTVKLQTEPTVTVTVTVSSDDPGAATATVSGSTLRFTASNWETEQTVTVAGVDDGDSANETVTVTNTASGGEYAGVTASVRVTVDDDDKPGITFTPASLTVGEAGVGRYTVRLNAAPTADVTVAISSSNPDVTVNTSSLTFTTVNYATNQRVDVTAAEDADAADDTANLRHRPSGGDYSAGEAKDFMVTVTDDDTAGLVLSATTLGVDEAGQNTYTVKLQTQPTTTVTVTVSSDDTDAATVSGPTLRFTTSNWDTEQTVTVRGVNDGDSDGEFVTITNTASGGEYAGVTASVTVTVDDDDTRGITFTPAARTIREGATGTYDVKLNTAPTADVTVAISSDNPDVTVNKSSLTFTTVNYARNQRVTVTAAQDADAADGTANLTHRPSGGDYSAGEAKDFMVTVTDDDTAGLVLSATTLGVDEAGQNTYTVKLQTQPTTTVTVTVSSDDTGAATATVSGSTLIFTASNWETEQTVTVEGVDDGDSANETVTVTNTASDGEYEGVTASVRVTVDDDDKPGITFTPASLTVGEAGVGRYGVRLNAAPTADVTVAISSSNPDVTVMPNSLTFTSSNWETEQTVDVTAAEDADAADDTANLRHRPSGGGYGSGQNKDLIVTVTDYDTAGLMLSTTTLTVDEAGQNTYTVKLQTEPTVTVTVTVSSDDPGAATATVSGSTLRFTASNWDTEQTVTVAGVDDGDSANETVTVTNTASGGEYAGVTASVRVTVDDDDKPGITFTPASLTVGEAGVGRYTVRLNAAPTSDVTVAISSSNPDVTVMPNSLTFTSSNWETEQTVTVTAAEDADAADDTANLTHRPSGGDYSAGEAKDFMVTVTDDDTAGLVLSATTLGVDEAGQNTYTVKLQTEPTVTVTVTVSSDDPGAAEVIFSPLRFTASNWDTEQTVTVAGVDDGDSANETVTVTNTASGGEYEGVTASVRVTVDDDDKPGITFTPASLTVGEAGVGRYTVRLNAAPTSDVTVAISSSNPDVTVMPNSLTFTSSNWETEQTVDVTAAEDADAADDTANLRHRPSGGGYGSGQNKDLIVTVTDYDTARLMLSTTTLTVDEAGQNTYTVKLDTQPTTTVTVTVSSDDTDAATVSGPTLRFTTSNWDTEQTVTVRGVNDGDSDDETVTITNTASGGEYAGVTASVTVTVDDDDTRGITFTPAARTIREGATGTYDVKLNTAPTADVTVAISSDNPDVTVNKSSLTFTTVNYARNQRVTVTAGQDADAADGTANLTHRPSGGDYSAGEAKDFMVTVTDDDTAGLVLSATTLGVDEAGQNTYTVKLQTEPTTTVTVTVSSDDPGAATATVSGSTLIFTASNWETEQTVTVEGVDDGDSANETVTVTNTASGGEYEGVTASVRVTVDDDDKPGITFTPASLTVGEAGVGRYTVRLNAAPTSDVTVAISSSNPDVTVNKSSLTFTTVNYATNQRVTVAAAEDADAADDTANLTHRPSGGGYGSGQNKDLIVTVTDYDTARLELSVWFLDVDEGGQNTYTVKLQTQPTTTVTVTVSSDDTDAATVSGPTLRFTTSNWDTEQTVTVRGVNDGDSDGELVTITNTASGGEYAGVTETVWLFVDDDDTRGITFTPAARTIREGATGTYDVKLNTAPTADVTVAISSDNPDVTVNKSSLTFTTVNYATNQRVTVTAAQDADAADGTANLRHRPSGGDYSAGEAKDFMVTVTDDDTAGLDALGHDAGGG